MFQEPLRRLAPPHTLGAHEELRSRGVAQQFRQCRAAPLGDVRQKGELIRFHQDLHAS